MNRIRFFDNSVRTAWDFLERSGDITDTGEASHSSHAIKTYERANAERLRRFKMIAFKGTFEVTRSDALSG